MSNATDWQSVYFSVVRRYKITKRIYNDTGGLKPRIQLASWSSRSPPISAEVLKTRLISATLIRYEKLLTELLIQN